MKKTIFLGRTIKDVEMRYTQGENSMAIAKTSIAIDSGYGDKKKTDFFNITSFGKLAERFERFVPKGTKILVECEPNQEQYTDKNGNKVNTVSFIVNNFEFCESKANNSNASNGPAPSNVSNDGFMNIPDGVEDGLPF